MASKLLWSTPSAWTALAGGTATATLVSLANGSGVVSDAYDNVTNREQVMDITLRIRFASAPGSVGLVDVYMLVNTADGYEDGGASTIPNLSPIATFQTAASAAQQMLTIKQVGIPPEAFKLLIVNRGGQATTSTAAENKLTIRTYSPVAQ